MHSLQETKLVNMTPPAVIVDNASLTITSLDTLGFNDAQIVVALGATDIALSVCKLQESDDNSTWSDVSGGTYGTDANSTGSTSSLPSATDDNHIFAWDVRCGAGRKRYLRPVVTVGNGTSGAYAVVIGILGRGSITPHNASERGLTQVLQIP